LILAVSLMMFPLTSLAVSQGRLGIFQTVLQRLGGGKEALGVLEILDTISIQKAVEKKITV